MILLYALITILLLILIFFAIYILMENLPSFLENLSETIREYNYLKENIREIKELKKQRKMK